MKFLLELGFSSFTNIFQNTLFVHHSIDIFLFGGGSWPPMSCCTSVSFNSCCFPKTSIKRKTFGTYKGLKSFDLIIGTIFIHNCTQMHVPKIYWEQWGLTVSTTVWTSNVCVLEVVRNILCRWIKPICREQIVKCLSTYQVVGMPKLEDNIAMKQNQDRFGRRAVNLRLVSVAKH